MGPMKTKYMPLNQSAQLEDEKDDHSREPGRRRNSLISASKNGLIVLLALSNLALVLHAIRVSSRDEQLPEDFGEHYVYNPNTFVSKLDSDH